MPGIQASKRSSLDSTDVKKGDRKRIESSGKGKCTETV